MESSKWKEANGEGTLAEHRIEYILMAIALVLWMTILLSIHHA